MFYYGCRFGLVLTAVAELVGSLVLTVAADLLVEQLVYYVYEGEVREAYRPKGLLAYATAAREYVRLL
jgi:hypothetical protein